ncbi:endoglucanase [Labedella gwakjiensis]|nr:glycoside hydrolase family 9 protein [Labedella gwakjiensis]PSL37614.1 endoglucanase [Labedella gwakjiensis]
MIDRPIRRHRASEPPSMRRRGAHRTARWSRTTAAVAAAAIALATLSATPAHAATVQEVAVSQGGYSAGAYKTASVVADGAVGGSTCRILQGGTVVVPSCTLLDRGATWGKRVYVVDFTSFATVGTGYTLEVGGVASPPFDIATNVWEGYTDEMTAFYRLQRAGVASEDVYPDGYSSIAPSEKIFHGAGHLDDAASADGTEHYDLTGGWYDAGDYGKYAGNQWVGGQIAITYLRHGDTPAVAFDGDDNGVPDLVDEAVFGSEYLIRFAEEFDGALYDIKGSGGFQHPDKHTDNIVGTADDRRISGLGVGGSAKAAGTLAATARAIAFAIDNGHLDPSVVTEYEGIAALAESTALTYYDYAVANQSGPIGSYSTRAGIANSLLYAQVQLHLLTGETAYRSAAETTIAGSSFTVLSSTNYWDMGPLSMAELYPVATASGKTNIQRYLKQQLDYVLSSTDDTPYGVVDQFKNFGVNEPHASYMADTLRYYELFGDQRALRAVLKGMYWMMGNNPWNTSWVSGVGRDSVRFLHTRLDEEAQSQTGTGVVLPGALVSGPNATDPLDPTSGMPWYEDRPVWQDSGQQWRYNEYSISIQAGFLYSIFGLTAVGDAPSSTGTPPVALTVTSPLPGDYVTGDVTVFAQSGSSLTNHAIGPNWTPMTSSGGVSTGTFNVDALAPFTTARVDVRGTMASGAYSYSSTHYRVAPPLPTPSTPLLYDGFGKDGVFGMQGYTWVNWYNNHAGVGSVTNVTEDGRTAAKFFQNPATAMSQAKFQPWHHSIDARGYGFLSLTMKSPSPNNRVRIDVTDGVHNYKLSGNTPVAVPNAWTDYDFDLTAFPDLDLSKLKIVLWLQQTADTDGTLFVDDVELTNKASGTAPTLMGTGFSPSSASATTPVTFTTTYTDADGQAPHVVQLVVDGVIKTMTAVSASDTNVIDGKAYAVTLTLPRGPHTYSVRTTDTTSGVVSTTPVAGPTIP